MNITTISSRDFNQDVGKAKRAAAKGPVVITDRGEPAHVLLSIDEYQRLVEGKESLADLLANKQAAAIELEIPRVKATTLRSPRLADS
jgi:prevent-host-death family protein